MIGLTYSPKKSSIQQRDSTRSLLEYGASLKRRNGEIKRIQDPPIYP